MTESSSTKTRALEAALTLFADKGYEATTLNDIAGELGIKAASLFAHFRGKEAIFRETLEKATVDWQATVAGIFAAAEGIGRLKEGLERILYGFAATISGSVTYRFWARVYVFPPPVVGKADMERFASMDRKFEELLAGYCAARAPVGTSRARMEAFCAVLWNMTMGIMVNGATRDEAFLAEEMKRSLDFMVEALETAASGGQGVAK
jgi:AcrR family transcriptional regulator